MATFDSQIAADLASVINTGELSDAITYTPAGGSPKNINAIVFGVDTNRDDDEHGETEVKRRRVVILTDATLGVAAPRINDVVAISSVNWRVDDIEAQGHGRTILSVVSGGPEVKSHDQHKKKISS